MLVSAIHQHESAIGIHMFHPSWASLPPRTPSHTSRLSQPRVPGWASCGSLTFNYLFHCFKFIAPIHIYLEFGKCLLRKLHLASSIYSYWRRKWQPTPVFWPGESHEQQDLACCSPGDVRVLKHYIQVFLFILTAACEVVTLSILI